STSPALFQVVNSNLLIHASTTSKSPAAGSGDGSSTNVIGMFAVVRKSQKASASLSGPTKIVTRIVDEHFISIDRKRERLIFAETQQDDLLGDPLWKLLERQ